MACRNVACTLLTRVQHSQTLSLTRPFFTNYVKSTHYTLSAGLTKALLGVALAMVGNSHLPCRGDARNPTMQEGVNGATKSQDSSRVTYIYLLQHGETDYNVERRLPGQSDIPLNKKGKMQARIIANSFKKLGILDNVDAIVSSDLVRARVTAEEIAGLCSSAKFSCDQNLRELNPGDYTGRIISFDEYSQLINPWTKGNFNHAIRGGESLNNLIDRGLQALRTAAQAGQCVIVVSHYSFLRWISVAIQLGTAIPSEETMNSQEILKLVNVRYSNCTYSVLVYDHGTDSFHGTKWFDSLPLAPARRAESLEWDAL